MRSKLLSHFMRALVTLALVGVSSYAIAQSNDDADPYSSFADQPAPDYVPVPFAGWMHKSCVHETPPNAALKVNADGSSHVIDRTTGATMRVVGKCPHKHFPPGWQHDRDQERTTKVAPAPIQTVNWVESSTAVAGPGRWMTGLSTNWTVPKDPSTKTPQLLYFFNGVFETTCGEIYQPVLQWGVSPAGGGQYWGIANWQVETCVSGNAWPSRFTRINAGQSVRGDLDSSACTTSGVCEWNVAYRIDGGAWHESIYTGIRKVDNVSRGTLEAYGVTTCRQYPTQTVAFTDTRAYAGNSANPNGRLPLDIGIWQQTVTNQSGPSCSYRVMILDDFSVRLMYDWTL